MSLSRRDFLTRLSAIGAVWFAGATACRSETDPRTDSLAAPADSVPPIPKLVHFTPEDAADIEAIAARIIPTDETPGAREAGVVYFIDQSMTTFAKGQQKLFADGLAQLRKDVAQKHPGTTAFAALTAEQQDALLTAMEKSEFFGAMRFATISGMFAHPKYGGNRGYAGWKLVGRESTLHFEPPFGWYDRPENQRVLLGRVL